MARTITSTTRPRYRTSRGPHRTRDRAWPAPARPFGSFALTYTAGWTVTDTENNVPASVRLMVERAVQFRAGGGGVGKIGIGSLNLSVPASYATDAFPRELASIARAYAYRPGVFAARP